MSPEQLEHYFKSCLFVLWMCLPLHALAFLHPISYCHPAKQNTTGTVDPVVLSNCYHGSSPPCLDLPPDTACFWGNDLASCQCISSCNSRQALPPGQNQKRGDERDVRDLSQWLWIIAGTDGGRCWCFSQITFSLSSSVCQAWAVKITNSSSNHFCPLKTIGLRNPLKK